jgi:hypothetical protein
MRHLSRIIDIRELRYSSFGGGHHNLRSNEQAETRLMGNESFIEAALPENAGRQHYSSRDKLAIAYNNGSRFNDREWNELEYPVQTTSLLVQSVHGSFAGHIPLSLRPDTIWYAIVHEVGVHVKQNSEQYAGLFTDTPGVQQTIEVRHDGLRYDAPSPWNEAIPLFYGQLEERIGTDKCELFVPKFTTTTVEDKVSTIVALMDVVSPYFKYEVHTMCHIPQVNLEGTAEDWRSLHDRTAQLRTMFDGLDGYFADLLDVLQEIANTAAGGTVDNEFWGSLYKFNEQSGGQYVTGWINALFAHVQTPQGLKPKDSYGWQSSMRRGYGGYSLNEFPAHVSVVPFLWKYFGQSIPMTFFAGITGVDYAEDTFLQPRLGYGVAELKR